MKNHRGKRPIRSSLLTFYSANNNRRPWAMPKKAFDGTLSLYDSEWIRIRITRRHDHEIHAKLARERERERERDSRRFEWKLWPRESPDAADSARMHLHLHVICITASRPVSIASSTLWIHGSIRWCVYSRKDFSYFRALLRSTGFFVFARFNGYFFFPRTGFKRVMTSPTVFLERTRGHQVAHLRPPKPPPWERR